MKICSKCGCENNDNASFCNNCGADISGKPQQNRPLPKGNPDLMTTCPACGQPISKQTNICPHCGINISVYKAKLYEEEHPITTTQKAIGGFFGFLGIFLIITFVAAFL